jgi:hypothetical protein
MRAIGPAILLLSSALVLGACGAGHVRKEIEGNNTGGVIPPAALTGKSAQTIADAHCGKWNTRARITFSGADAGGDTIFVCETAAGPAVLGADVPAAAPQTKQAPAKQQAPVKR